MINVLFSLFLFIAIGIALFTMVMFVAMSIWTIVYLVRGKWK